jgi:hypothetical protein
MPRAKSGQLPEKNTGRLVELTPFSTAAAGGATVVLNIPRDLIGVSFGIEPFGDSCSGRSDGAGPRRDSERLNGYTSGPLTRKNGPRLAPPRFALFPVPGTPPSNPRRMQRGLLPQHLCRRCRTAGGDCAAWGDYRRAAGADKREWHDRYGRRWRRRRRRWGTGGGRSSRYRVRRDWGRLGRGHWRCSGRASDRRCQRLGIHRPGDRLKAGFHYPDGQDGAPARDARPGDRWQTAGSDCA